MKPSASPQSRQRADAALVRHVARRLTPRDRLICHTLWDHRVLTTAQLTDLAFESRITAQHRLAELARLRVLDRFRHWRPVGSDPYHYVLDELGAALVAADRGVEAPKVGQLRARATSLADSQRLAHLLGVNGVFCALARWARHEPDAILAEWWSERRCAAEWGEVVRPDGFGALRRGSARVEFFLEYDAGTETLGRLAAKLDGYADLALGTDWHPWVAFWFPSPGREAEARRVLVHRGVPVVTGADGIGPDPGGPAWLGLGAAAPRLHLADLPAAPRRRS